MEAVLTPPPANFNFAAHLEALGRERAAKTAYVDDTRALTYGELAELSRRFATGLARAGVHREERILLIMLDTVDLPVAFLGALYAGVVPVVVNTLLTADDYAYMIAHSKAQLVIASGALMPTVQAALDKVAGTTGAAPPPCVVSPPVAGRTDAASFKSATFAPSFDTTFDALLDGPPSALPADTAGDDIAFWLYSSGSTGKPKGTVHTHANLYWTAETYGRHVLGVREDDIVFSAAKLFFAYGLGNGLTFPLSVGATVVLMAERPTAEAVAKRLRQHRPTIFYGVPTLYATLLSSPHLPARDEVALRLCTSAGEALPREIGERFTAHFGAEILDGIGSTEMLHIFLSNRAGQVAYGTTGEPVPGYAVELRDEHGNPVPDGEIGDLYIKGPSAALMYWCNREKSRSTFLGDWLKSGDKYQRLPNGYYVYAGRSDDMLKVSGQYVSPIEVEMVLMQHDAVLEAGVVGRDDNGLTKTQAFVVLKPGIVATDEMASELKAFVKARLAPHKYPRELVFVDDLPKTATGKVQRFKLRELL